MVYRRTSCKSELYNSCLIHANELYNHQYVMTNSTIQNYRFEFYPWTRFLIVVILNYLFLIEGHNRRNRICIGNVTEKVIVNFP